MVLLFAATMVDYPSPKLPSKTALARQRMAKQRADEAAALEAIRCSRIAHEQPSKAMQARARKLIKASRCGVKITDTSPINSPGRWMAQETESANNLGEHLSAKPELVAPGAGGDGGAEGSIVPWGLQPPRPRAGAKPKNHFVVDAYQHMRIGDNPLIAYRPVTARPPAEPPADVRRRFRQKSRQFDDRVRRPTSVPILSIPPPVPPPDSYREGAGMSGMGVGMLDDLGEDGLPPGSFHDFPLYYDDASEAAAAASAVGSAASTPQLAPAPSAFWPWALGPAASEDDDAIHSDGSSDEDAAVVAAAPASSSLHLALLKARAAEGDSATSSERRSGGASVLDDVADDEDELLLTPSPRKPAPDDGQGAWMRCLRCLPPPPQPQQHAPPPAEDRIESADSARLQDSSRAANVASPAPASPALVDGVREVRVRVKVSESGRIRAAIDSDYEA